MRRWCKRWPSAAALTLASHPQIRVLDKMTVERMSAERSQCLQRIEQRALQERLETERSQVRRPKQPGPQQGWRQEVRTRVKRLLASFL